MKYYNVIVKVDLVNEDETTIIDQACQGTVRYIDKYYGIEVESQPLNSRVYEKDDADLGYIERLMADIMLYGDYYDSGVGIKDHSLVVVSLCITDREINRWKLKDLPSYEEFVSGKYEPQVFCSIKSRLHLE